MPDGWRKKELAGRVMLVKALDMLPVECVVRGYLIGSGWRDYQQTGATSGVALPQGLRQADKLPEPIFTPAAKAEVGEHDENITMDDVVNTVGPDLAAEMERVSIAVYERAAADCAEAGIILADTKFEMGTAQGTLTLGDEVCTPDSSRFWPADTYEPGTSPPSFDKQYLRDWLDQSGWDHTPPAPDLPPDVVAGTRQRYVDAYERITGRSFDSWLKEAAE
jgi:phosphoribosylaminoimidazole-succinocarboxamide synthase